jgi:hypothetical protein
MVPGASADIETVRVSAPQTASLQDFQAKAEPVRVMDNAQSRNDDPKPVAAPAEPPEPEKAPAQPLRSVALEFTPDGAREVRVRLSERAGEVHVSVHSSDPSVTNSLRSGVTDLASVLAHAGYDAQTWTSGRQQQENPQQHEEQTAQSRGKASGADAESFDQAIQSSQEKS